MAGTAIFLVIVFNLCRYLGVPLGTEDYVVFYGTLGLCTILSWGEKQQ